MSKVSVLNIKGEKTSDVTLNKDIWAIEPNDAVLYDALVLSQASLRQGTASTKTRSDVSGGGANHGVKKVLDVLVKVAVWLQTGQVAELYSDHIHVHTK